VVAQTYLNTTSAGSLWALARFWRSKTSKEPPAQGQLNVECSGKLQWKHGLAALTGKLFGAAVEPSFA
jgi:hypothetical protein